MSNSTNFHIKNKDTGMSVNNSTFEVESGASLSLIGYSDHVTVDSGAASVSIQGSYDTIDGSSTTGTFFYSSGYGNTITAGEKNYTSDNGNNDTVTGGANSTVSLSGNNDTANVGANSAVSVSGNGDIVNVGTNSTVSLYWGTNATVNAMSGNTQIGVYGGTGSVINAVNDTINLGFGESCTLTGSNNEIFLGGGCTVITRTATLTENQNGIVLTGGTNPGAVTLTDGVVTVHLDDGNVATFAGINSGSTFEYVDSAGKTTVTTLTDSSLLHLGGSLYEVTGVVSTNQDNGIFEVDSGASLSLAGSHDQIIATDGAQDVSVSGNGNTIIGTGAGIPIFSVSGSANVVSISDSATSLDGLPWEMGPLLPILGPTVIDYGNGTTVTVGKNIEIFEFGTNATINALKGGDAILVAGDGNIVNANNANIAAEASFTLSGSNNALSVDNMWNPGVEIIATNASLTEDKNGITLTGSANAGSVTLANGTATVQMGNGNVATITQVASGETLTYIDAAGKQTTTTLMDSNLQHVAGNLYNVNASVTANLNNLMFDVLSGASLNLNGSSNQVILSNNVGAIGINGTADTVIGSSVSGVNVSVSGTANVVSLGIGSTVAVGDGGSSYYGQVVDGNTITVGANSTVDDWGTNETINATQGGSHIKVNGSGTTNDVVNANNSAIELNTIDATTTVNGNGNQITFDNEGYNGSVDTLRLNGSNNSVSIEYAFGLNSYWGPTKDVETGTSSLAVTSSGGIVLSSKGTGAGAATLTNGILTVQLGGGNVAAVNDVLSGTTYEYIDASGKATYTTLQDTGVGSSQLLGASAPASTPGIQANQLVAAMASYSGSDAGAATTGGIQMPADSAFHNALVASTLH